jgi:regulator of nucleoside diphosphate kinase
MRIGRYLTQYDASILCKLAESLLRLREVDFNAGEKLLEIISASIILPEHVRKKDCVSLFSKVTYSNINPDVSESIELVCPQDANQKLARVSVLSPIGLALIGQKVHTIVNVESPFGSIHHIKIIDVKSLVTVDVELAGSSGRFFQ